MVRSHSRTLSRIHCGARPSRLSRSVDPGLHVEVRDGVRVRRVGRLQPLHLLEQRGLLGCRPGVPAETGSDPDHADDAVGSFDGRVEGGGAAHRVADQDGPVDPEPVQQGDQVVARREVDVVSGRLPPARACPGGRRVDRADQAGGHDASQDSSWAIPAWISTIGGPGALVAVSAAGRRARRGSWSLVSGMRRSSRLPGWLPTGLPPVAFARHGCSSRRSSRAPRSPT